MKKRHIWLSLLLSVLVVISCGFIAGEIDYWMNDREGKITGLDRYEASQIKGEMSRLFPSVIPESVVSGEYLNYHYYTHIDIYLELRFGDESSMKQYLETMTNRFSSDEVLMMENPFSHLYSDIIPQIGGSKDGKGTGVYLEIKSGEERGTHFVCDYAVISYSYDELTVITTVIDCATYVKNVEKDSTRVPQYLKKFRSDLIQPFEHRVYFVEREEAVYRREKEYEFFSRYEWKW